MEHWDDQRLLEYSLNLSRATESVADELMERAGVQIGMLGYFLLPGCSEMITLTAAERERFEGLLATVIKDPVLCEHGNRLGLLWASEAPNLEPPSYSSIEELQANAHEQLEYFEKSQQALERCGHLLRLTQIFADGLAIFAKLLACSGKENDREEAIRLLIRQLEAQKGPSLILLAVAKDCDAFCDRDFLAAMHPYADRYPEVAFDILNSAPAAAEQIPIEESSAVLETLLPCAGFEVVDTIETLSLERDGLQYECGPFIRIAPDQRRLTADVEQFLDQFFLKVREQNFGLESAISAKEFSITPVLSGQKTAKLVACYFDRVLRTDGFLYYAKALSKGNSEQRKKAAAMLEEYVKRTPEVELGFDYLQVALALGVPEKNIPAVPMLQDAYSDLLPDEKKSARQSGKTKGTDWTVPPAYQSEYSPETALARKRFIPIALRVRAQFALVLRKSGRLMLTHRKYLDVPIILSAGYPAPMEENDAEQFEALFKLLEQQPPQGDDFDLLFDHRFQRHLESAMVVHEQFYLLHWYMEAYDCAHLYAAYAWASAEDNGNAIRELCRQLESKRPKGGRYAEYFRDLCEFAVSIGADQDKTFQSSLRKAGLSGSFNDKVRQLSERKMQEEVETLWQQGYGELELCEWQKAIATFDNIEKLQTDYWELYARRAWAHFKIGNLAQAEADATRAIKLCHDRWAPYDIRGCVRNWQGENNSALADFHKAVKYSRGFEAVPLFNRATLYLETQRYALALKDFTRALECCHDPDLKVRLYGNRANAYLNAGQPEAALEDADAALAIDGDDACSLIARGQALAALGRKEEAVSYLSRSLAAMAENDWKADVYVALAHVLYELEQRQSAHQALDEALKLCPEHAEARNARSRFQ